MTWWALALKMLGVRGLIAVALGIALLGSGVAYRLQGNRLEAAGVALANERAQVQSLVRQVERERKASKEWQQAVATLTEDVQRLHVERDRLAAANRAAVRRVREAERRYVPPPAPSNTCAAALKALDTACPELRKY